MSAPALIACAAAALCLGVPLIAASAHVEAAHRAAGAADAAALAAADAQAGLVAGNPCDVAAAVAGSADASIVACELDAAGSEARVRVAVGGALGSVTGAARAGAPAGGALPDGPVRPNGWAWPSAVPGITQDLHDGASIDLMAADGSPLYAPYDGVVVAAGADGGGIPTKCVAEPSWWHGPNFTVLIRHEYRGRILYSSHNHVAPGSPQALGIRVGATVRAGQAVALAGMSGCSSGPHTHFTLSTTASNAFPDVNPYLYIGGAEQ